MESIPESQYRAWVLEHTPTPDDGKPHTRQLDYTGWGQPQMLMLDMRNLLETIHIIVARLAGDEKTEPDFISPPGVDVKPGQGRVLEGTYDNALRFFGHI